MSFNHNFTTEIHCIQQQQKLILIRCQIYMSLTFTWNACVHFISIKTKHNFICIPYFYLFFLHHSSNQFIINATHIWEMCALFFVCFFMTLLCVKSGEIKTRILRTSQEIWIASYFLMMLLLALVDSESSKLMFIWYKYHTNILLLFIIRHIHF